MRVKSQEEVDNALDVLKDLVRENEELRAENLIFKRFLVAACLNSETGSIEFTPSELRDNEDIDTLASMVQVNAHYNNSLYQGRNLHPSECFLSFSWGDPRMIWVKRSQQDIIKRFEELRYKETN